MSTADWRLGRGLGEGKGLSRASSSGGLGAPNAAVWVGGAAPLRVFRAALFSCRGAHACQSASWRTGVMAPSLEIKLEEMPPVSSFGVGCRCTEPSGAEEEEAAPRK